MDTALPQKFLYILDRNLAKANCTENRVCTLCDIVVIGKSIFLVRMCLFILTSDKIHILCLAYSNSCTKEIAKYTWTVNAHLSKKTF